jgi:predicted flap endonuclease-1-like 5' DNA nuclease
MSPQKERRLRTAIGLLESTLIEAEGGRADPTVYTARYLKTSYHHELGEIDLAREEAERLVDLIDPPKGTERRSRRPDSNLESYLSSIRPAAQIMLGTLEVLSPPAPTGVRGRSRFDAIDRHSPIALVQYNFACAHSLLAEHSRDDPERRAEATTALQHLARALALNPWYSAYARSDVFLSWVQNSPETLGQFNELIRAASPPATGAGAGEGSPLARIELIGTEYAATLAKRGIHTANNLLERAATPAARAEIAGGLAVPAALVLRWADLADLTRVVGIEPVQVNLLHLAGVGGVNELAASNVPDLAAMLAAVAPQMGADPPTPAAAASWVRQAASLPAVLAR